MSRNNSFTVEGVVKLIGVVEEISEKFSKRGIVIELEDEKYPQEVLFEFVNDKCSLLDDVHAGDRVKVYFMVRGSEWKGRHFVNLGGWKIDVLERGGSSVGAEGVMADHGFKEESGEGASGVEDDVPF